MGTELVHQDPVRHLRHLAFSKIANLEGPERQPDQTIDLQAQRTEHALHLAVLAFLQADRQPDVRALYLVELRLDRSVAHAFDRDAVLQLVEIGLGDCAPGAHAVTPRPAGGRQFEQPRQGAVIGQQQQAFGIDIETADRNHARHAGRQALEDRRATFGILRRRHESGRLVIAPEPCRLLLRQGLAVDDDCLATGHVEGGALQHLAVNRHTTVGNQLLGLATRTDAGAGDDLGNALALGRCIGGGRF